MNESAERYARRDEIQSTYATCERLLSRLDELRMALRSMRYRSAFDDAALARMATLADSVRSFEPSEHAADPIADCLSDCLADPQSESTVALWESWFSDFEDILRKEQSGDFFPFPEPLQDGERRVLAAKLGELLRELESIATDADDLTAPLQANMRYAAATKPFEPFRMLDDTQRTVLSWPLHLCRLFRSWGRLAQVYLLSGEQSLRDALRSTRIPKWDPQELAYRIDSERSQLLRDLAELAPSLTSQSEPHRPTAASDAPAAADTPSTTAAIDPQSACITSATQPPRQYRDIWVRVTQYADACDKDRETVWELAEQHLHNGTQRKQLPSGRRERLVLFDAMQPLAQLHWGKDPAAIESKIGNYVDPGHELHKSKALS